MSILVAGGHGQLGRHLAEQGGERVLALGRADLNLLNSMAVASALDNYLPEVFINAAAYTNVDAAESDSARAWEVNVEAASILARECAARGVPLIHVSTDYVFSGDVPARIDPPGGSLRPPAKSITDDPATAPALKPDDQLEPRTEYGRTKLEGERAVHNVCPQAVIVRTAWLYTGPGRAELGLAGNDFVSTMLGRAAQTGEVSVVNDQWGSPTYAGDLASGLLELCALITNSASELGGLVLHASNSGRATWWDLARAVFALSGADPDRVRPCTTAEFPRPAPRPSFSVLSGASWAAAGLRPLPPWQEALAQRIAGSRENGER